MHCILQQLTIIAAYQKPAHMQLDNAEFSIVRGEEIGFSTEFKFPTSKQNTEHTLTPQPHMYVYPFSTTNGLSSLVLALVDHCVLITPELIKFHSPRP